MRLRKLLVGAILLGGNVTVPKGKMVGATFKNVPACQLAGQTHCVIAYSSFLKEPPNPSYFGRVASPLLGGVPPTEEEIKNNEVLCTNPSVLFGNAAGPLFRYESTTPFPGLLAPFAPGAKGSTPWVADPDQYSGQCDRAGGATWLQLTPTSSTDTGQGCPAHVPARIDDVIHMRHRVQRDGPVCAPRCTRTGPRPYTLVARPCASEPIDR